MLKLIIEDDEGHTTVVPLVRDEVTIGRKEGNTIRLTERNVSRRHARLMRQDASFALEDLASYTGVRVNGHRIGTLTPLKDGDRIQIGDYRLDVRSDEPRASKEDNTATLPSLPRPVLTGAAAAQFAPAAQRTTAATLPAAETLAETRPDQVSPMGAGAAAPVAAAGGAAPLAAAVLHSPVPRGNGAPGALLAAAPTALEGTPTIPLRTLDSPSEPIVVPEKAGRLVVLNTELAGHEFSLSRGSQVIGRTDENDIVLNHRSISRHHAKVLREGPRTLIVDLQSANGVRVNGQDYERVELQPGDIIELGHVKVRHVGPDEDFVFSPGALGGRFKPAWVALGAVGATALVIVLTVVLRHGPAPVAEKDATGQKTSAATTIATSAAAPGATTQGSTEAPTVAEDQPPAAVAAAGPPPAPPVIPVAPSTIVETPRGTLAAVNEAIASERWEDATGTLESLLKKKKDEPRAAWVPEAEALKARIADERKNAVLLAEVDQALEQKDGERAMARIQNIPATSVFKVKALGRQPEATAFMVKQRLQRAQGELDRGACDEVKAEERLIHRLDPENAEITELVRACRPHTRTVAAVRPAPAHPVAAVAATTTTKARASEVAQMRDTEEPTQDPTELIKQARDAWLKGQYAAAIDLSKKALKLRPGSPDAYQIIAVCACSQRDAEGAQRAYAKLDERNKTMVRSTCLRNNVHLPE